MAIPALASLALVTAVLVAIPAYEMIRFGDHRRDLLVRIRGADA